MKTADLAHIRLHNQQLAVKKDQSPREIVAWLGAMQAQEMISSKWAIGIRLPGATEKQIDKALDRGEILRTHVLRPTWHYVAPEDIHWMLALTAPQVKAGLKSRHKQLEFTEAIFKKSNQAIEKALSNGEHLTRKEIVAILKKVKIDGAGERGAHLLWRAETDGIICSGAQRGKEITYALLGQRVSTGKSLPREEALRTLAHRYFTGHGPATVRDFIWWSGLSVTDGKLALEMVKKQFDSITIDEQEYWLSPDLKIPPKEKKSSCFLLPPFDEYIIAYADRSAVLSDDSKKSNLFENGLFKGVILLNGKAIGNWKRTFKKDKMLLETQYFKKPAKTTEALVKKAWKEYERFMG